MSTALAVIVIAIFGSAGTVKALGGSAMRGHAYRLGFSPMEFRAIGGLELAGALGIGVGLVIPAIGVFAAIVLIMLMLGAVGVQTLCQNGLAGIGPPLAATLTVTAYLISNI